MTEIFSRIKALYQEYGNTKYMIDEEITQTEHALQAANIAVKCGAPPHIIIGMLFHDIGQLIGLQTISESGEIINELHKSHDDIGAKWLKENGLPSCVTDIAQYHTLAKVIICDRDPNYLSKLSKASQESFLIQKKKYNSDYPLSDETVELIVSCRYIDDMAKLDNYSPGCLDDYLDTYNKVMSPDYFPGDDKSWMNCVYNM